jgi:hypothetical protein
MIVFNATPGCECETCVAIRRATPRIPTLEEQRRHDRFMRELSNPERKPLRDRIHTG